MEKVYTPVEKDEILRDAFSKLSSRGITSDWAITPKPFTNLRAECDKLIADPEFARELQAFLRSRTVIRRSVEMFFTQIAMSARAQWHDVAVAIRPVAARGWFLGRWTPTFLIIDGPIGRFLCADISPFQTRLGSEYPLLTAARDFLNDRLFRLLRNSFAHWAFDWEVIGGESYVVAYDWDRDLPIAKLHQQEADAFHIIAFALIEVLNDVFLAQNESHEHS
jgi:hypothetical protein